jgi:hypothetical protein
VLRLNWRELLFGEARENYSSIVLLFNGGGWEKVEGTQTGDSQIGTGTTLEIGFRSTFLNGSLAKNRHLQQSVNSPSGFKTNCYSGIAALVVGCDLLGRRFRADKQPLGR